MLILRKTGISEASLKSLEGINFSSVSDPFVQSTISDDQNYKNWYQVFLLMEGIEIIGFIIFIPIEKMLYDALIDGEYISNINPKMIIRDSPYLLLHSYKINKSSLIESFMILTAFFKEIVSVYTNKQICYIIKHENTYDMMKHFMTFKKLNKNNDSIYTLDVANTNIDKKLL